MSSEFSLSPRGHIIPRQTIIDLKYRDELIKEWLLSDVECFKCWILNKKESEISKFLKEIKNTDDWMKENNISLDDLKQSFRINKRNQ